MGAIDKRIRDCKVRKLAREGARIVDLAKSFGLSERQVRRILYRGEGGENGIN